MNNKRRNYLKKRKFKTKIFKKWPKGTMTLGGYVQISDDINNPIWIKLSDNIEREL